VLGPDVLSAVTEKRVETTRELRRRGWRGHLTKAHYGYGWRIYRFGEHDVVLHAGGVRGFRTFIAYSRGTGIGFAIMMNAQTRAIDRLSSYFWVKAFEDATQTAAAP
jgi:beta-lactamase class C